jgi:hypothetical protein
MHESAMSKGSAVALAVARSFLPLPALSLPLSVLFVVIP